MCSSHCSRFPFADSVALVTGAGSGIGRAVSLELAKQGCSLALVGLHHDNLNETQKLCLQKSPNKQTKCTVHAYDLRSSENIKKLTEEVLKAHGKVNILVNNAGIAANGLLEDTSEADFRNLMEINLFALVNLTHELFPTLKAQKRAAIVNVSSMAGFYAFSAVGAYVTSKFAVKGFTEQLRAECNLYHSNISVILVCPGFVRTDIIHNSKIDFSTNPSLKLSMTEDKMQAWFESNILTEAEEAGEIISDAIKFGRNRVLVGEDAKYVDFITRRFPSCYLNKTLGPALYSVLNILRPVFRANKKLPVQVTCHRVKLLFAVLLLGVACGKAREWKQLNDVNK